MEQNVHRAKQKSNSSNGAKYFGTKSALKLLLFTIEYVGCSSSFSKSKIKLQVISNKPIYFFECYDSKSPEAQEYHKPECCFQNAQLTDPH